MTSAQATDKRRPRPDTAEKGKSLLSLSMVVTLAGVATRSRRLQRTGIRMVVAQLVAVGARHAATRLLEGPSPRRVPRLTAADAVARHRTPPLPSGGAARVVAVGQAVARAYPWAQPLLTAAAAVRASKRPEPERKPADIVAGAITGLVAERLADLVISVVEHRRNKRRSRPKQRRHG